MDLTTLSTFYKALGDPARLRMLHLLSREELSVGELVRILDLPQSSVSRHLKTLREEGVVTDRPAGPATYYRANPEPGTANGDSAARESLLEMMRENALSATDRQRLDQVLALRRSDEDSFFNRIGSRWDALREAWFGPSFHLEALVGLLPRTWVVADLGTGTGYLLPVLGRHFERVIALDNDPAMLGLAERRVSENSLTNVELRLGDLERMPLAKGEVDLALVVLMLHHLGDMAAPLAEIARILKPGGKALIVELDSYNNEAFRAKMGDRRAGISRAELSEAISAVGLLDTQFRDLACVAHPDQHDIAPVPRLYSVVATKPGANASTSFAATRRGKQNRKGTK